MSHERSRSQRLRRWMREHAFLLVICGAAIPIGAGPIVGGERGPLVQSIGGDVLAGYAIFQARAKSSRRDHDDEDH